jgi:ubiquinone/menaquinone biosynthesis C-methylase UbiE
MSVLDAGCGTGDDVRAMAEIAGVTGQVVGVDASSAMIAEAISRGVPANVRFVQSRVEELPFRSGSFHACRAERLFQHLADADAAAFELRRVLLPGGSLLAFDPDWETIVIRGADPATTRRILNAFRNHTANPRVGRVVAAALRRANFRSIVSSRTYFHADFARAYDLVLHSALDCARRDGVVSAEEAAEWIAALQNAEHHSDFFFAVVSVATLASA